MYVAGFTICDSATRSGANCGLSSVTIGEGSTTTAYIHLDTVPESGTVVQFSISSASSGVVSVNPASVTFSSTYTVGTGVEVVLTAVNNDIDHATDQTADITFSIDTTGTTASGYAALGDATLVATVNDNDTGGWSINMKVSFDAICR